MSDATRAYTKKLVNEAMAKLQDAMRSLESTGAKEQDVNSQWLFSKEHYDLLEHFERIHRLNSTYREKDQAWWKRGAVYANGEINRDFISFRIGYQLGKRVAEGEAQHATPQEATQ